MSDTTRQETAAPLAPCPFCGGKARLEHYEVPYNDAFRVFYVRCRKCLASSRKVDVHFEKSRRAAEHVTKIWNRRAEAAEARAANLALALTELLSWFPKEPSPPEWRIRAGERGADEAIEHARAAIRD